MAGEKIVSSFLTLAAEDLSKLGLKTGDEVWDVSKSLNEK